MKLRTRSRTELAPTETQAPTPALEAPVRRRRRAAEGDADAKTRLLTVAERLFAERGFSCTSIRDLATEANVNIAAVNYHFHSKEELYLETLRYAMRRSKDLTPRFVHILRTAQRIGTPEAARRGIARFIMTFITHLYGQPGETDYSVALMSHEMVHPTGALDIVVREFIQPRYEILTALIRLARPDLKDDTAVALHALSIAGQCLHIHFCRPIALKLAGERRLTPRLVRQIALHVAEFSLKGLSPTALPLKGLLDAEAETESRPESNVGSSAA
ncbi:MAG: CerR family C-terminal domain-containing protein [Chloracidobacterium sp.]|nr:CerR family C-terminal domain-containing protein [Chloracidobacterium sp.]MDW8218496.1 CerR family C-terminal domain-containing protein [Acidobacteriota bacterium]